MAGAPQCGAVPRPPWYLATVLCSACAGRQSALDPAGEQAAELARIFWWMSAGALVIWLGVILIGIAAAAHQGWSANLFTLTSDTFPKQAVGSVVGIGGMFGAIGGMVIAPVVGYILARTGSYVPIFIIAASAYLVALGIIHLLVPKLEPAKLEA